ncbi:MAG: 4a-hydroxytetrahydrobiopterin dehydratase [Planctomycetota bacterium]
MSDEAGAQALSSAGLCRARCVPCEGGVPRLNENEIASHLEVLAGWEFRSDPDRIRKAWTTRNFASAMKFLNSVAELAEAEGHHPDVHVRRYRHVEIEIWTHAIGGLSVNDFILAAKIDQLPMELLPK